MGDARYLWNVSILEELLYSERMAFGSCKSEAIWEL